MALFTGQQAHAGVTGRGSTPSTRTVPRRQGDGTFHRSAGARGADRARFHAAHLRCLAPAEGIARLHRPAGVQGADRARFHAAHLRCLAPAGGQRGCTGQQEYKGRTERGSTPLICAVSRQQGDSAVAPASRSTRGGQSEVPRRSFALSRASRGDSAVAPASRSTRGGQSEVPRRSFALSRASRGDSAVAPASRSTRGGQSEGPRRPSALSRASEGGQRGCTGQQEHAGRTERGSTPSICAIPRQRGG